MHSNNDRIMRSIIEATCSCRLGASCRIFAACLILRYVSNFLYMYDGLTAVSSTTPKSDQAVVLEKQLMVALDPKPAIEQRFNEKVEIVDTSTWAQPSSSYVINNSDLWERNDDILPRWMVHYFRWHREQTSDGYDITGPLKNKFLYVTCFKEYRKCGGTADRLLR